MRLIACFLNAWRSLFRCKASVRFCFAERSCTSLRPHFFRTACGREHGRGGESSSKTNLLVCCHCCLKGMHTTRIQAAITDPNNGVLGNRIVNRNNATLALQLCCASVSGRHQSLWSAPPKSHLAKRSAHNDAKYHTATFTTFTFQACKRNALQWSRVHQKKRSFFQAVFA